MTAQTNPPTASDTSGSPDAPGSSRQRRRLPRVLARVAAGLVALAVAVVGVAVVVAAAGISRPSQPVTAPLRTPFEGGQLLVAADVDMVATAYADGVLQQLPGATDTLSVVELPWGDDEPTVTDLPAPNAVTSWPDVVAASPDGTRAYVIETDASPSPGTRQLAVEDFTPGTRLTVVDLTSSPPAVTGVVEVGERPLVLDVSPDGSSLAIGFDGGRVGVFAAEDIVEGDGEASAVESGAVIQLETAAGARPEEASSVAWHPSGDFLAVGLDNQEVSMHRVERSATGTLALPRHGDVLLTGSTVTAGRFTPDGERFVTADIRWDTVPRPIGQILNPRGRLVVVEVDVSRTAQHVETARVPVGQSPEGVALSPDGQYAVTVDMRRSYLPAALSWWPGADGNGLSLVELGDDGSAEVLGEYSFDGVLPEDAAFDATGDTLAVTVFHDREERPEDGRVELWNVVDGDSAGGARLEATDVSLTTPRGPHSVWLTGS